MAKGMIFCTPNPWILKSHFQISMFRNCNCQRDVHQMKNSLMFGNCVPVHTDTIRMRLQTHKLFQQPILLNDVHHFQGKPHLHPRGTWTPFFSVWWGSIPHLGPAYDSLRRVKNVGFAVIPCVFRLIGFNSVNRRPYIVKSGMFQSSRNPSWAVILLAGGILSDWTFIRLVPYTCHHSGRPASNQKAKNIFTEIRDSPLSRKRECMILGPRTKSVHGRQK